MTCPRDLENKGRVFQQLEDGSGAWSHGRKVSPDWCLGCSGRIGRPMGLDARHQAILQDIEIAESPQERFQRMARVSYVRLQSGGRDRAFFDDSTSLFAACPDVKKHFDNVEMAKQQALLNKAIQLLIDFDPARGCDQLAKLAGTHTRFALTKDHYDHFLEVLMQTIEQIGTKSPEDLEAWRASITPALEFMRTSSRYIGRCSFREYFRRARP